MEQIKVNMIPNGEVKTIHCSKGDGKTRKWGFELYKEDGVIPASSISPQMFFGSYKGGTEEVLPENGSEPTTSPIIADIQYPDVLRSEQEFLYRESPSTVDGSAKINRIKGNTLVWNQLVQNGNFADTSVWQNGSSYISGGKLAFQKRTGGTDQYTFQNVPFVSGHKYLLLVDAKATDTATTNFSYVQAVSLGVSSMFITSTTRQLYSRKETAIENSNKRVLVQNGFDSGVEVYNIMVIDLTQLDQDLSADQFTSLFSLPYYDYTLGKLLPFKGEELKTVGFNQWDEQMELGGLDPTNGSEWSSSNRLRTKNYNPCFGSTTYYMGIASISNVSSICFYDGAKTFVSAVSPVSNNIFTTPTNAVYFRFQLIPAYGTTYNNDICVNISSSENGKYEPYTSFTINLPTLNYFPTGMKSVGSAYDEKTESKAITRIGEIVFDGINNSMTFNGSSSVGVEAYGTISNKKNGLTNLVSNKFTTKDTSDTNCIRGRSGSNAVSFVCPSGTFTDTTSLNTWLQSNNVAIYYELATPTEENITTASLVTEKGETVCYGEDDMLIVECNQEITSQSGEFPAKIKLQDGDGIAYSSLIKLVVEEKPNDNSAL